MTQLFYAVKMMIMIPAFKIIGSCSCATLGKNATAIGVNVRPAASGARAALLLLATIFLTSACTCPACAARLLRSSQSDAAGYVEIEDTLTLLAAAGAAKGVDAVAALTAGAASAAVAASAAGAVSAATTKTAPDYDSDKYPPIVIDTQPQQHAPARDLQLQSLDTATTKTAAAAHPHVHGSLPHADTDVHDSETAPWCAHLRVAAAFAVVEDPSTGRAAFLNGTVTISNSGPHVAALGNVDVRLCGRPHATDDVRALASCPEADAPAGGSVTCTWSVPLPRAPAAAGALHLEWGGVIATAYLALEGDCCHSEVLSPETGLAGGECSARYLHGG